MSQRTPDSHRTPNRREFLQAAVVAGAAATIVPYWLTASRARAQQPSKSDRHVIGCIGTGDRWKQLVNDASDPPGLKVGRIMDFGDVVAVCDVDRRHVELARATVGGKAEMHEDYRKVLDRNDIDVVTIVTPDHWHAKIAVEAMLAGKDVYCEKPLTLTIDEGKKICQVQQQTGRVFQVGTQQRSEFSGADRKNDKRYQWQFLQAVALAHSGRLGKVQRAKITIRNCPTSPALPKAEVLDGLNWEMWQGQAPLAEFVLGNQSKVRPHFPMSRCHYEFRWWYEYSGGKLTDWGAHHVDIAQWALGMDHSGPVSVDGTGEHPVVFKDGYPTVDDQYNCATTFHVKCAFPNGAEILIDSGNEDSIWIEGDQAEIYVNRATLEDVRGEVVAQMEDNPIPEELILKLCKGKKPGSHMGNFFECIADRSLPISDVFTHHRAITTCHLANISIRLNRPLKWDPDKEGIVGDDEANRWLAREQRKGYEILV